MTGAWCLRALCCSFTSLSSLGGHADEDLAVPLPSLAFVRELTPRHSLPYYAHIYRGATIREELNCAKPPPSMTSPVGERREETLAHSGTSAWKVLTLKNKTRHQKEATYKRREREREMHYTVAVQIFIPISPLFSENTNYTTTQFNLR